MADMKLVDEQTSAAPLPKAARVEIELDDGTVMIWKGEDAVKYVTLVNDVLHLYQMNTGTQLHVPEPSQKFRLPGAGGHCQTPERKECANRALGKTVPTARRRLPDTRQSLTHKFSIGNFEAYMTVGMYPDGTPGELFLKAAKEGATMSGLLDAFAIMVSLALQYGVPLKSITDKLSFSRFEPSGFTGRKGIEFATSPIDYVVRFLAQKFLLTEESPKPVPPMLSLPPTPETTGDGPPCEHCGHLMIRSGETSCFVCPNCASTSGCGS